MLLFYLLTHQNTVITEYTVIILEYTIFFKVYYKTVCPVRTATVS